MMKGEFSMGLLAILCALSVACGPASENNEANANKPSISVPGPIQITAESKGLIFRYLSEDGTRVKTAQSIDEIPEACRHQVVVIPSAPEEVPPAGWDFVADLSSPLPQTIEAQSGFNLETRPVRRVAQQETSAGTAPELSGTGQAMQIPPVKEARNKSVSMFSSPGCPYCDKARNFLERKQVSFSEYDLERNGRRAREKLAQLAQAAGVNPQTLTGVPIIFVGKHVIRGFDRRRLSQLLGI